MLTKKVAISRAKKFLAECSELPLDIERAILFGSSVNGKANKNSDIDLALFSKKFSDNILQNLDLIGRVNIRYPEIDVHTFPVSYKKQKGILLEQILKTGVEVGI